MILSAAKIYVVGVGPGDRELVTLKASSIIRSADYVAGFQSALAVIQDLVQGQAITLDYHNQNDAIMRICELAMQGHSCVVCVCGDPSVSDRQLIDRFNPKGVEMELVPGISSVQAACARLRLPLEETVLVTFHKRGSIEEEKRQLLELARMGTRNLLLLPRPWDFMPAEMARFLLREKVEPDRRVTVLQRVTFEDESVWTSTLRELVEKDQGTFSDLSIVVIGSNGLEQRPGRERILSRDVRLPS